jgi:hypothetical protein
MLRHLLMGTAAGTVGTVALNVATYADMAIRGRPRVASQPRWPASWPTKQVFPSPQEARAPTTRRDRTARAGWAPCSAT